MFKNHLVIIIRSLKKAPLYFFINLFGLSVGIASCITLLHYTYFESDYDSFHSNAENKYRIVVEDEGGVSATTPIPTGGLITDELSQVKDYVVIRKANGVVKRIDNINTISDIEEKVVMASPSFFEMFSFELLNGNSKDLEKPNQVFIAKSVADKYFNSNEILGKELLLYDRNFGELKLEVAGVMQDPPVNTHLPVRIVLSLKTIEENDHFWAKFDNWGWNDFYTYLELADNTQITQKESNTFIDSHIGAENRKRAGIEVKFQPVSSIHLDSEIMNSYQSVRDARINTFLKIVGIFILFMACINYVNLAGANGLKRAKEVGVRKNMGASRLNVVGQFAMESLILNVLSCLLAFTALQIIWPFLANTIGGAFTIDFWDSTNFYSILLPVLVGITWTVVQPSLIIASFPMIKVLKGNISSIGKGKVYRKGSIVLQFIVSLTLIIISYVIYSQINFLQNKDLGININRKLIIEKPKENIEGFDRKADVFKQSLKGLSLVNDVSYSGSVPTKGYNYSTNNLQRSDREPNPPGEYGINITYIDNEYVKIYQPKLLAGKAVNIMESTDLKVLINEKALEPLAINSVQEALGMMITNGEVEMEIIGVIDSYLHNSVKDESSPVLFMFDKNPQYFTVFYNSKEDVLGTTKEVLNQTQEIYGSLFPDTNFKYSFLDEEFESQYRFERFFGNIMLAFTLLAVLLAVIGLFGLSMFDMERKTKEVGIRKTLGASSINLFVQNLKPFTRLLALACVLALPVAHFLSQNWLADYTFKIELEILAFIVPVVILFLITLLTISYHLITLNNTNPVDSLRYE